MVIIQKLLTPNKYSRPGKKLQKVNAVAVHYTGNPGSTGINNRNYFESLKNQAGKKNPTYASSHYIVGLQGEIYQLIPETEWSYCTNERNKDTISIETCHPDSTGKFKGATYQSLVKFCADICRRHGLDPLGGGLIRHYDVTGKHCPKWFVDHPDAWLNFKQDVKKEMVKMMEEKKTLSPNPPDWAEADWAWAAAEKLLDGTRPNEGMTRAEFAVVLHKLEDRWGK